ncbi:MAG: response regulator [Thiocapsa sp.]|uniref:response regulator n=1 Tax=Thiocapsa sp. TaxID=2024551 RepID=UPI001BCCCCD6|nr:response regulator [Thiocapsa sp.]QVL49628.1 MAG: response regulator [Thiocapsa sp.]
MDKLIQRQLRRANLSQDALPNDPGAWQGFLDRVNRSYEEHARDRYLLERSLEVSSREMQALYDELRRSSASEVAAERDKLAAIIGGFRDGFCSLDPHGRLVGMNPASENLLGERAALLGEPILERFRFSRREDAQAPPSADAILARLQGARSYRDDKAVLVDALGGAIPVSVLVYPIVQGGVMTGCALSFRDVSSRLAAEAARLRLAKAVEASADAIYVTDLSGVIEYINPAFVRITGIDAEQAIGARSGILASGLTPRERYRELWDTIARGEVWSGRLLNRRRTPDGGSQTYWVQTTIAPFADDGGTLGGFVAVQRDITRDVAEEMRREREVAVAEARARVAERLQGTGRLEQRLAAALDALAALQTLQLSGTAVIVADQGDGEPLIRLQRGAPPDSVLDALRRPLGDELDPVHLDALNGILLPIAQGGALLGRAWLGVEETPDLDGVELGLLSLVAGMIGVAIADDHARTEAERSRLAALEAVEAKSRFLANMSHEIRTPMNGVLGMLEMLAQTRLDADQQDYVETARGSADALLTVINDILDFSKIEAGKLDPERVPFDLRPLAEDVASLLSSRNQSSRLELACYIPVDLDTRVVGDPTRLRQVLNNLMGNAIKFTEEGEVVLRVDAVDHSAAGMGAAKQVLRFEVVDTGIGMTEAQLGRLFLPFVQADGSMTRRFGGTGLGLAISKPLVELMGGEIGAASVHGRGSTFWFTIPFDRQAGLAAPIALEDLAGVRVLAVDDKETNRTILGHYLQSWGLSCEMAGNGFRALKLLREAVDSGRPFEVAIIDMQMPQLDGITLARLIRADPKIAETPILMMSSAGQNGEALAAVGIHDSLSKPVRQSHLHDALVRIIHHRTRGTQRPAPAREAPDATPAPDSRIQLRGHVLLVEDNLINQRVALSMLTRLGLTADVAEDGCKALTAAARGRYDLILMDCQMPNMDGFEASAELRRREEQEGCPRTPIVALTANVMQGDRERCFAAGMDDYLPKPLKLERLRETLGRWMQAEPAVPERCLDEGEDLDAIQLAVDPDAMDTLKRLLGEDYAHYLDLVLAKTEDLMKTLQEAVDGRDAARLATAAHALKGSAGNLGASRLCELAGRLEQQGSESDLRDVARLLEQTQCAQQRVSDDLRRLRALESTA